MFNRLFIFVFLLNFSIVLKSQNFTYYSQDYIVFGQNKLDSISIENDFIYLKKYKEPEIKIPIQEVLKISKSSNKNYIDELLLNTLGLGILTSVNSNYYYTVGVSAFYLLIFYIIYKSNRVMIIETKAKDYILYTGFKTRKIYKALKLKYPTIFK